MEQYLINTLKEMGAEMSPEQAGKFRLYHEMLLSANREMNLTRIGEDEREACDRNYLDSLTLLSFLGDAKTLIDVGSGAGFPGIPLAIMRPDIRVTLLDSLGKRVSFLNAVIEELGLNAKAVHLRCEDAAKMPAYRDSFDIACARAVAAMDVLSEWLLPFVRLGGLMLAMKGPAAEEECREAAFAIESLSGEIELISRADIPGRDWDHRIVQIHKTAPTPERFPRKAGMAERRPLRRKT